MSNIEKIRQEIESKMRETDDSQFGIGGRCMCRIILSFIDSLPEEKPSEDLEEAAEKWCKENGRGFVLRDKAAYYIGETLPAFIAGAEWQKKQQ